MALTVIGQEHKAIGAGRMLRDLLQALGRMLMEIDGKLEQIVEILEED